MQRISVVLTMAFVLCATQRARAESAVVLPHTGDTRLEAARSSAHRAVFESLREQGLTVRALVSKPSRAQDELHSKCTQVGCVAGVLSEHDIDLAVAVAVWQGEDGPQANVTLIDALGRKYPGYALVVANDAETAGRAALLEARSLNLLGPGPWVHVRGAPAGASVYIDGKAVGVMPYRGALSPGDHALEVRAQGYATKKQTLTVPLDPTTTSRAEIELMRQGLQPLSPAEAAALPAEPDNTVVAVDDYVQDDPARGPIDAPSPFNWLLGGALAVGGLALATIEPIQTAAREGDCAKRTEDGACTETYKVGGQTIAKVAIGAALVGAGVAVMIWQPLRVEADVGPDHARIHAKVSF